LDLLIAAPVQHNLAMLLFQLLPRRLDVELVMPGERLHQRKVVSRAPIPAADSAARDGKLRMMNDTGRVEELLYAQAGAGGTCTRGIAEREQARLELRQAVAADRAGELIREDELLALRVVEKCDSHDAFGQL